MAKISRAILLASTMRRHTLEPFQSSYSPARPHSRRNSVVSPESNICSTLRSSQFCRNLTVSNMKRFLPLLLTFMALASGLPALGETRPLRQTPTMLEMTFPEFESQISGTDVMLLPVGAIEAHGPHLPLNADGLGAVGQLDEVRAYLETKGANAMVGPLLNIGITNETGDQSHDGTYIYPGSLTIGSQAFVNLYVDLIRSLRDSGVHTVVLYSGHLGGRHLEAMASAAQEASRTIPGLRAYAVIDSERLERLKIIRDDHILVLDKGLNFPMLSDLLSEGAKPDFTTHADGWETSLLLHFRPDVVRPGYRELPHASSPTFIQAIMSGDREKNPSGIGGFPTHKASGEIGKRIAAYRTKLIGDAILGIANTKSTKD